MEPRADFELFFHDAYERLVRVLLVMAGSPAEAEDLVQEAMARAYGRWDRVGAMASPIGYVYRSAVNLHRSRLRRLRTALRLRRVDPVVDAIGNSELRLSLQRALEALPPAQRDAVVLVDWLGLEAAEAGAVLGIEPASVRGRLHRARITLREQLGEER